MDLEFVTFLALIITTLSKPIEVTQSTQPTPEKVSLSSLFSIGPDAQGEIEAVENNNSEEGLVLGEVKCESSPLLVFVRPGLVSVNNQKPNQPYPNKPNNVDVEDTPTGPIVSGAYGKTEVSQVLTVTSHQDKGLLTHTQHYAPGNNFEGYKKPPAIIVSTTYVSGDYPRTIIVSNNPVLDAHTKTEFFDLDSKTKVEPGAGRLDMPAVAPNWQNLVDSGKPTINQVISSSFNYGHVDSTNPIVEVVSEKNSGLNAEMDDSKKRRAMNDLINPEKLNTTETTYDASESTQPPRGITMSSSALNALMSVAIVTATNSTLQSLNTSVTVQEPITIVIATNPDGQSQLMTKEPDDFSSYQERVTIVTPSSISANDNQPEPDKFFSNADDNQTTTSSTEKPLTSSIDLLPPIAMVETSTETTIKQQLLEMDASTERPGTSNQQKPTEADLTTNHVVVQMTNEQTYTTEILFQSNSSTNQPLSNVTVDQVIPLGETSTTSGLNDEEPSTYETNTQSSQEFTIFSSSFQEQKSTTIANTDKQPSLIDNIVVNVQNTLNMGNENLGSSMNLFQQMSVEVSDSGQTAAPLSFNLGLLNGFSNPFFTSTLNNFGQSNSYHKPTNEEVSNSDFHQMFQGGFSTIQKPFTIHKFHESSNEFSGSTLKPFEQGFSGGFFAQLNNQFGSNKINSSKTTVSISSHPDLSHSHHSSSGVAISTNPTTGEVMHFEHHSSSSNLHGSDKPSSIFVSTSSVNGEKPHTVIITSHPSKDHIHMDSFHKDQDEEDIVIGSDFTLNNFTGLPDEEDFPATDYNSNSSRPINAFNTSVIPNVEMVFKESSTTTTSSSFVTDFVTEIKTESMAEAETTMSLIGQSSDSMMNADGVSEQPISGTNKFNQSQVQSILSAPLIHQKPSLMITNSFSTNSSDSEDDFVQSDFAISKITGIPGEDHVVLEAWSDFMGKPHQSTSTLSVSNQDVQTTTSSSSHVLLEEEHVSTTTVNSLIEVETSDLTKEKISTMANTNANEQMSSITEEELPSETFTTEPTVKLEESTTMSPISAVQDQTTLISNITVEDQDLIQLVTTDPAMVSPYQTEEVVLEDVNNLGVTPTVLDTSATSTTTIKAETTQVEELTSQPTTYLTQTQTLADSFTSASKEVSRKLSSPDLPVTDSSINEFTIDTADNPSTEEFFLIDYEDDPENRKSRSLETKISVPSFSIDNQEGDTIFIARNPELGEVVQTKYVLPDFSDFYTRMEMEKNQEIQKTNFLAVLYLSNKTNDDSSVKVGTYPPSEPVWFYDLNS